MSATNGVIRVGRKGKKKFAFGEENPNNPSEGVFEVDVVTAFQNWLCIDDDFRERSDDRTIPINDMNEYHGAAVHFVKGLAGAAAQDITTAEALDFLARLREEYDRLTDFFLPKSLVEQGSPDSSGAGLVFSEEPGGN